MNRKQPLLRMAPMTLLIVLSVAGCGRLSGGTAAPQATAPAVAVDATGGEPSGESTAAAGEPSGEPTATAGEPTDTPVPTFAWPATDPISGYLQQIDRVLDDTTNSLDQSQPATEGD